MGRSQQMSYEKKNKALFIDRDGTINHDCPYCRDPSQIILYEDTINLMREYKREGYLVVIVTNQSGINRGYFSVEELERFHYELKDRLLKHGVPIDAIYYCPHRPEEKCSCRKPEPGLILNAVDDLNIDLAESVVVGDRDDIDGELARRLNIPYTIVDHRP